MKQIFSLALSLFVAAFMFTGCDDLTTVSINVPMSTEHTFPIAGNNSSFADARTINLNDYDDFKNNKSKLTNVEIESIQYKITNHVGSPSQTISGTIAVMGTDQVPTTLHSINNWNLKNQADASLNDWVTLNVDQVGKDRLVNLVKNDPNTGTIGLMGTTNETPVAFNLVFKINWKLTAEEDMVK
jgi:hypothetical protein